MITGCTDNIKHSVIRVLGYVNIPLKRLGFQVTRVSFVESLRQKNRFLRSTQHQIEVYQARTRRVCEGEFLSQFKNNKIRLNERAVEYSCALQAIARTKAMSILDVGSGKSPWPALLRACGYVVTAIDSMGDFWGQKILNRHFHVIEDDITQSKREEQYDIVTCISTLEHIPNHTDAVENMKRLTKPGGYLILSFPYNESRYISNNYDLPGSGYGQDAHYICQTFSRKELNQWLNDGWGEIVEQRYFKAFTGAFWTVGERIIPPVEVTPQDTHHLTVICLRRKDMGVNN